MSPASKAQQKAVAKYMKNNYDEVKIHTPKGQKAAIHAAAEAVGHLSTGTLRRPCRGAWSGKTGSKKALSA